MRTSATLFGALGALVLTACTEAAAPPPDKASAPAAPAAPAAAASPAAAGPSAAQAAEEIFKTRCTPCHGVGGAGDGPASAGLTPKPANLTLPEWQQKVTDDHIEKIITYGGMAVGKSAAMPPNPDLDAKPEVIKALRAYVRGLAAK